MKERYRAMAKVDYKKVRESKRYKAALSRIIEITMSCDVLEAMQQIRWIDRDHGKNDKVIHLACEDLLESLKETLERQIG